MRRYATNFHHGTQVSSSDLLELGVDPIAVGFCDCKKRLQQSRKSDKSFAQSTSDANSNTDIRCRWGTCKKQIPQNSFIRDQFLSDRRPDKIDFREINDVQKALRLEMLSKEGRNSGDTLEVACPSSQDDYNVASLRSTNATIAERVQT